MAKIDDNELQSICSDFMRRALGAPTGEVSVLRDRNIRAYNAQPVEEFAPPEIQDRSQYVSNDVAEVVDGMLPQLLDVFVSDDTALECVPRKPDVPPSAQSPNGVNYTQMAKDASAYLNHLFYARNDGLNILYDWIHDACLQKVGFAQVWKTDEETETREQFSGLLPEQVAVLQAQGYEIQAQQDPDGTLSGTATLKKTEVKYNIAVVPPHEMRIDPNARWGAEPKAIGRVSNKPKFELEAFGYDVDSIAGVVSNSDTEQYNVEANDMLGEAQGDSYTSEIHDSHMLYEYAELYMMLDVDGDGVAEWRQCCLINGILVSNEEVDDHIFVEMCLLPRPHAYFGDCPADRAYDIQRENTNLSRALLDNTYLSVNNRTYINLQASVNVDDLLDNRPGGIVRGSGEPGKSIMPIPTQGVPGEAFSMQEWLENQRDNRTGFTRYSQGLDAESLNKTAHGVDILTQKSDMRLRLMSRFAAQAIAKMFRKVLKLATEYQKQRDWFAVNGRFIAVNPTEWKDQFDIQINVGLGHGTKQQQAQRIMALLPLQMQGLNMGIVLPEQIANTIRLYAQTMEFKNPDQFVLETPQGPPYPLLMQKVQQLQQQLQQTQQQNMMLQAQHAARQGDLAIKSQALNLKAQEVGANIAHKAHGAVLDESKANHENAAAALDNAATAHQFGMNMALAHEQKQFAEALALANQAAGGQ